MTRRYPDSPVLYRKLTKTFPLVVRGEGCYLYDDTGRRYLDGSGGAYVANCGHGVGEIVDAMTEQARRVAFLTGAAFTNQAVEELGAELLSLAWGDLNKFHFLSSGSDAVEAALKLARQYWVDQGLPAKHKLIALTPAYHGNTLLALSVSARPPYSSYYGDWLVKVARMPAPYAYRCDCDGNPRCARCTGALLDEIIGREGPDTVAAFIGEPVGGSSTGGAVPRPEYWKTVREICTRHRVLWIADEVLCGAGRTGTWSALEPYGAVPDLAVFGKGISGGYAPLSAVAAPERILDVIARKSGGVLHGQTFANSPVICAAGVAAIRYLKRHRLIERAAAMGPVLQQKLAPLRELAPVGDIRGRGLLAGIELVQDRRTKAPFPRAAKVAERVTEAALEAGLVVWPNTGHANGTDGDQVMLAPPFIIEEPQIDEAVASLRSAIASVA